MNYTYTRLVDNIIEASQFEYTRFDGDFNFDDCTVIVHGSVYQDFDYVKGDYWSLSWVTLSSRTADIESVTIQYEEGVYEFTEEELNGLEKDLRK